MMKSFEPHSKALAVLAGLALLFTLREAKALLAPIVFAGVLTFVLAPLVRWLRRRGVPELLGAALVVGALLASTVPLAATLAAPAASWWERAPTTLAQLTAQFERLRAAVPGLALAAAASAPAGRRGTTPANPAAAPDPLKDRLASEGVVLTGLLLGQGASLAVSAASTVILLYFLLASEHWIVSRCVEAIERRRTRALVLGGLRAAQYQIGHFLLAISLVNLGIGLSTGVAVHLLGLQNPLLWAVVAGVLNFVPYLGPLTTAGLLLLAGMASFTELGAMLAPAAAFMVIHWIEANLVSPWVVSRRLSLSPISVFVSVMFWGWLWGIAGALLAVPILIGVRSVCRRNPRLRLLSRFLDRDLVPPPSLRSLLGGRRRLTAVRTDAALRHRA